MTYSEIRKNEEVLTFIKKGNANLGAMGFTDHSSTSFLPSCVNSCVFIYILFRVHCTIRLQIRATIRYILFRSYFFLQGALYVTKTVAATLSRAGKQHVISG